MIERMERTMTENGMLDMSSVLVALSGGADSVALLHCLCRLSERHGFDVYAAHVNHGLRGAEADADEAFARELAGGFGVEFFSLRADVRSIAREERVSEELAGRRVRYGFFDKLMREHGIERTATAHHRCDNAETIIMNFLRGSGIRGLRGIPYSRGAYIRPLLDVTREDIEKYCAENGLDYVTDKTNLGMDYTRNRIRNGLIPELKRDFNPSVVETITENAAILSLEDEYLDSVAAAAYAREVKEGSVAVSALLAMHKAIALRLIRRMIGEVCGTEDIASSAILRIYSLAERARTGSETDVARGAVARISYGRLAIFPRRCRTEEYCLPLPTGKRIYVPQAGFSILAEYVTDMTPRRGTEYFAVPSDCRLEVRSRRAGDRFYPEGMEGSKKVKSYMVDAKIPREERGRIALLTCDGDIMWIVGRRRDRRFSAADDGPPWLGVTVTEGDGGVDS